MNIGPELVLAAPTGALRLKKIQQICGILTCLLKQLADLNLLHLFMSFVLLDTRSHALFISILAKCLGPRSFFVFLS